MRAPMVAWLVLCAAACAPPAPAKFPDDDRVAAAQQKWCDMLAKLEAPDGNWLSRRDCEAGEPTGSAQYIERMTPCFEQQRRDYGDAAPDSGAIIDSCTTEVLSGSDPGDVSQTEVMKARCERMLRCQQLDQDACDGVLERLDPFTKAVLTNVYNLKAQAKIAACLRDTECSEDEDAAYDACYQTVRGYKLWLPL